MTKGYHHKDRRKRKTEAYAGTATVAILVEPEPILQAYIIGKHHIPQPVRGHMAQYAPDHLIMHGNIVVILDDDSYTIVTPEIFKRDYQWL